MNGWPRAGWPIRRCRGRGNRSIGSRLSRPSSHLAEAAVLMRGLRGNSLSPRAAEHYPYRFWTCIRLAALGLRRKPRRGGLSVGWAAYRIGSFCFAAARPGRQFQAACVVGRGSLGWHRHRRGRAAEKQKAGVVGPAGYKQATPTGFALILVAAGAWRWGRRARIKLHPRARWRGFLTALIFALRGGTP